MNTKPEIRQLKCTARSLLMGRHALLAAATLLTTVISLALDYISARLTGNMTSVIGLILTLAAFVLLNVVNYLILAGQHRMYLEFCRGGQLRLSELFSAFTWRPEPVAIYSVLQFVLYTLLSNLYLGYLEQCLGALTGQTSGGSLSGLLLVLAALLLNIWLQISLSMTLYLYCDNPERSIGAQIRNSFRLMKGLRWKFFCLCLSFFGLYLLCTLSFGIGLLFVQPYVITSEALFYDEIREKLSDGEEP